MFEQIDCIKTRSEITALSTLKDGLVAFSTKTHGAKIFSSESCSVTKNLSIEHLGYKTTAVAFSSDTELIAFANSNIIYIMNTKNKALTQTITTNDGIIEILSFVPNSMYLIAGTKSGRVMQYRYDGRSQLSRLCSFGHGNTKSIGKVKNNYVSAFVSNSEYFAFSGYGGTITLLKAHSHAGKRNINTSKVRINALCFLDDYRLVSANVDGLVQIHSLKDKQKTENINTPFINIKNIIVMPNPKFIMLCAESKNLVIIDTQINKVVSTNYISFKYDVARISLSAQNDLLVVLTSNQVLKVSLPTAEDIKHHIANNDIDKAYAIIDRDPMLKGTREYKRVEVMYNKLFTQAVTALINSNAKEARKILHKFSEIPSKEQEIKGIFKSFENYPRFKNLYLEKKYAIAYAMAEKHKVLQHTMQYIKMEEAFKEAFSFAQKQVLIGRKDLAKEILSPYVTSLSKKPIIKLLLDENSDFISFLKAIEVKNTIKIEYLLKKNELFADAPTYTAHKNSTQSLLDSIQNLINKGEIDSAIEQIKKLINNPSVKSELQDLYKECKIVKALQIKYKTNDYKACYEIIDENPSLNSLDLTKHLEEKWVVLVDRCEEYALKGDFKSIKRELKELIRVQTRVSKIGDLIRVSFHTRMKVLMAKKSWKSAESIIYSYIDIFGADREALVIMKMYEKASGKKLAITINQDERVSRDNWLNSELIMGRG